MSRDVFFSEIVGGAWAPGIGDPSIVGWLTVAAYFASALACGMASRAGRMSTDRPAASAIFWRPDLVAGRGRPPAEPDGKFEGFWVVLTLLLVMLGINKQLDLQSLVTDVGRRLAHAQGWYEQRQQIQIRFVSGLAAAVAVAGLALLIAFRRDAARSPTAVVGALFLLGFIVVRAASFHHVDAFITSRLLGLRWNWLLELGGIALIAASAIRHASGTIQQ